VRPAAAGATAAIVWAALEPLDKRLFRLDYSDVALLGKGVTRSRLWPVAGLALHAANGAVFGVAARRLRVSPFALAMVENAALFPLTYFTDRHHPARGTPGLAPIFNARGFAQATLRHAIFGALTARLTR